MKSIIVITYDTSICCCGGQIEVFGLCWALVASIIGLSDTDSGLFLSDFCTLLILFKKKKKLMKKHWLHSEFPINGLTAAADAFSK